MLKKPLSLTIDPGLNGTGWALWDSRWNLICHGVINASSNPTTIDWKDRGIDISMQVYSLAGAKCRDLYIEFPEFYSSTVGTVTASSGSLVKLAWLVGFISGLVEYNNLHLITPTEWKGQLPKKVVIDRIKKRLPNVRAKSHDWDAIGIGLYLKGDF